jgi:hypothetical protein
LWVHHRDQRFDLGLEVVGFLPQRQDAQRRRSQDPDRSAVLQVAGRPWPQGCAVADLIVTGHTPQFCP